MCRVYVVCHKRSFAGQDELFEIVKMFTKKAYADELCCKLQTEVDEANASGSEEYWIEETFLSK